MCHWSTDTAPSITLCTPFLFAKIQSYTTFLIPLYQNHFLNRYRHTKLQPPGMVRNAQKNKKRKNRQALLYFRACILNTSIPICTNNAQLNKCMFGLIFLIPENGTLPLLMLSIFPYILSCMHTEGEGEYASYSQ